VDLIEEFTYPVWPSTIR